MPIYPHLDSLFSRARQDFTPRVCCEMPAWRIQIVLEYWRWAWPQILSPIISFVKLELASNYQIRAPSVYKTLENILKAEK